MEISELTGRPNGSTNVNSNVMGNTGAVAPVVSDDNDKVMLSYQKFQDASQAVQDLRDAGHESSTTLQIAIDKQRTTFMVLENAAEDATEKGEELPDEVAAVLFAASAQTESEEEELARIAGGVDSIFNWLPVYDKLRDQMDSREIAMKIITELVEKYKAVFSLIAKYTTPVMKDGKPDPNGNVIVKAQELITALNKEIMDFERNPDKVILTGTKEAVEKVQKAMKMDPRCIKDNGNGTLSLRSDTYDLLKIRDLFIEMRDAQGKNNPNDTKNGFLTAGQYSAYLTGIDGHDKGIDTMANKTGQIVVNAQQMFDAVLRQISSIIASLGDVAKESYR